MNTTHNQKQFTIQDRQKNTAARQLTQSEVIKLKELSSVASKARGAYYSDEVAKASQEFTELLFNLLNSGVRYSALSEATGLQWRSIKARLFRHGYIYPVPPSQHNKIFQGPKKPGPKCDHSPDRFRERTNKKTSRVTHIECLDCRKERRTQKKTNPENTIPLAA